VARHYGGVSSYSDLAASKPWEDKFGVVADCSGVAEAAACASLASRFAQGTWQGPGGVYIPIKD
jgi:hypothetical protein